ncbi:MAG: (2Fe-2S) ferredoxin domain-containing protein [Nitrospirae bacterium]|nr:(2Fe-2S) ferredoxin domain-containing protein [Nitrospirota bacterium]
MPKYTHHLFMCMNERPASDPRGSCTARGAGPLMEHLKVRAKEMDLPGVRANKAGCLDACDRGPSLVVYPEGVWYTVRTTADIDRILEEHVKGGRVVESLRMREM